MMMRRLLGVALALVATTVPATEAQASLRSSYLHNYHAVAKRFGARTPGRNIVRDGLRNGHRASRAHIRRSLAVLRRMLRPTPPRRVRVVRRPVAFTPVVTHARAPTPAADPAGLPDCTWRPESGGDWHALNASSGAGGRYQIIPSTWAAYGGHGSPQNASPAEQTAVAKRVYAGQGAGAWVNC